MKHGLVYKKLSYCRDSARRIHDGAFGEMTEIIITPFIKGQPPVRDSVRRRSLHCSRLFKVTNFDTNQKPVCEMKLVNNFNLHLSCTVFLLSRSVKLSPLTKGCLSLTQSFSVISLSIAINHILPATRFCCYIFVASSTICVYLQPVWRSWLWKLTHTAY